MKTNSIQVSFLMLAAAHAVPGLKKTIFSEPISTKAVGQMTTVVLKLTSQHSFIVNQDSGAAITRRIDQLQTAMMHQRLRALELIS